MTNIKLLNKAYGLKNLLETHPGAALNYRRLMPRQKELAEGALEIITMNGLSPDEHIVALSLLPGAMVKPCRDGEDSQPVYAVSIPGEEVWIVRLRPASCGCSIAVELGTVVPERDCHHFWIVKLWLTA